MATVLGNDDLTDEIVNVHYAPGPFFQKLQRYKAFSCMKNSELEAIHYLVESHAPGLRAKAVLRYEKSEGEMIPKGAVLGCNRSKSEKPPRITINKQYVAFNCRNTDLNQNIKQMLNIVEEMPKEWTLIQLTPQFNLEENLELGSDKFYTNPLHISTFYCGKNNPKPILMTVDAPRDSVNGQVINLVEEMQDLIRANKEVLSSSKKKSTFKHWSEKEAYYSKRSCIDNRLQKIVKDIQDLWLREWRCLLIGKYINSDVEKKIRDLVKRFLQKEAPEFHADEKLENLLVYIVKGSSYLSLAETKSAAHFCFPAPEQKKLHTTFVKFARNLSDSLFLIGEKKYPVILILDDTLDCFPWEMIDVLNEESVSRLPSLHFAYALFKEHENEIEGGFKMIKNYKKGTYIINPDVDLPNMENRIFSFFNYWTPNWSGLVGKRPSESEFQELLTSADIFSYNGHGAGNHFFSLDKVQQIHVKAVVLLFGCSSTQLWRIGPQVEMYGAYQMYLIACSPCTIGMLWTVTDVDTDMLTTEFLSQWIPSDVPVHWKHVDKTKWKKGEEKKVDCFVAKSPADKLNGKVYNEPDLLKALSVSKKTVSFYLTKAACVARGIPVKIKL